MGEGLQTEILERLDRDESLPEAIEDLVLAALLGQVEECLGGKTPRRPAVDETEPPEPARAFIESISVEGFRGIGPATVLSLTPGPGLTLVVGRNGSGKSSFAEALELLLTGDNQRWSTKGAKIWKEGWRNLHHGAGTRISAGLVLEARDGLHQLSRIWEPDDALESGEATVTQDGRETPAGSLGWSQPLTTYRPFLSYNELGSMLDEGPSKLFDALGSILGLEDLVAAAEALKTARTERDKRHRAVKSELRELKVDLEHHEDERATACAAALKGKSLQLDVVERASSIGGEAEAGSELEALQEIAGLVVPSPDRVRDAVSALGAAAARAATLEGTDAARARRRAELIEQALELHRHDGDGECPVCGREGALDADWRARATKEASVLRAEAEAVDEALRLVDAAERGARALVTAPPAILERAASVELDASGVERAWTRWETSEELDGIALAETLEARAPVLADAVESLRQSAKVELEAREDSWRPMARRLGEWLPGARRMLKEADTLKELKKAEDWIRTAAVELRNERFEPIKEDVLGLWEILRSRSNVELTDITFEGRATSRRVNLDVSVDGTSGAALGVMSQGELHALALALFLPRATLDKSPFRFVVIDDPVQSMDPARVDGLARVLERKASERQVVVFTHDDRLPEAVRRLRVPARIVEVLRREDSHVELREILDPVEQYLGDARALALTKDLPKIARERVVPGLCRQAIEAACLELVRNRRLARGETHESVEAAFREHVKLVPRLALALFDDPERGADVMPYIDNKFGRRQADAVKECNRGSHEGFGGDDAPTFVRDVERVARELRSRKD